MDTATEVRYAGVTVGRAAHLRDRDAAGAFLVFAEPLPVGTSIVLKLDGGEQPARVSAVVESADPNTAGMRLAFTTGAEVAKPAAPAPAVAAAEPSPAVAVPAAEPVPVAVEPSAAAVESLAPTDAAAEPSTPISPVGTAGEAPASDAGPPAPSEGDPGSGGHGKRRRRRR